MRSARVRLTTRGWALLAAGAVAAVGGALTGTVLLVQLGLLLLLAAGVAVAVLLVEVRRRARGGLEVRRRVVPHPVTVGSAAVVDVELATPRPRGAPSGLDRLEVTERAARELSGGAPLRARVSRGSHSLRLSYPITPRHRGRWTIGPLHVRHRDLFGVATWSGPVGRPAHVAVRPAVVLLSFSTSASSGEAERTHLGARVSSPDDSALRQYRPGDDLRRVHWRSTARRGELVVRQDERSGHLPASVVLDLPTDDAVTEWSISAGTSAALALLQVGHPVRLLGGGSPETAVGHHRPDPGGSGADGLLDAAVDLTRPGTAEERALRLRAAVDTIRTGAGGTGLVVAVVGAVDADLPALTGTAEPSHGWAMVRTSDDGRTVEPGAQRTADGLRRAGWTVCLVEPGEDVGRCWRRLLASGREPVTAR